MTIDSLQEAYFESIARADSTGISSLLMISSLTSSGQFCRKLCIEESAPARPSSVTCHVKASPLAFSESSSFEERGKELRHNSNIRGNNPLTTGTPKKAFVIAQQKK